MVGGKRESLAKISIRGVVQGVGFRPYVYQLAHKHHLKGWVCNTSRDVRVEAEGWQEEIGRFLEELQAGPPPLSRIEEVHCRYDRPVGHQGFEIRESLAENGEYQRISPDIASCPDCTRELFDPKDRRFRYPFINCTNCGPRLTIIRDIPYDRPKTTMQGFGMCPDCLREYADPLDRRFHAQPNCCAGCGPQVDLTDNRGKPVECTDPVVEAAALLKRGKIVSIKGIGGFLLACDATSDKAVERLRERKRRFFKPFAVMMETLSEVKTLCLVSEEEEAALTSPIAPIVLLRLRKRGFLSWSVSPNLHYVGAMLPYTPLHHLLMKEVGLPLVMTSGNLSEEPIAGDNDEALQRLGGITDYFLFHNRGIHARCDDSVTLVEKGELRVIRRARGYAPHPIHLPFSAEEVLACGADLKNTFCIVKDRYAFLSQHMGDMENLETLRHFEAMVDLYRKLFRLSPRIVAHDMHPDYLSTRYALELKAGDDAYRLFPVQHHHAHIVSCLVENGVETPVLGVAFDGTGYGPDGAVWGGEFLRAGYDRADRLGHLEYVPMPGGEAAVRRPYRMAASYLLTLLGDEVLDRRLPFLREVGKKEIAVLRHQIMKRINAPLTSSAGRLFDAVSALLGIRARAEYEAQAAIELEMTACEAEEKEGDRVYPFEIDEYEGKKVIRLKGIFRGLLEDMEKGSSMAGMSLKFHRTVAFLIARMCEMLCAEQGMEMCALSGGVFQNRLLFRLTVDALEAKGLKTLGHREVPCNDGGISLGQAVIAHHLATL